ncbi:MAG: chromosomal replication initiator protein DnaA [Candidatus Kaiserbacteria bacterium]|nr:chromosomal replication initiator protein DnaA [Candidatus Kaiserbacteria bacterium]
MEITQEADIQTLWDDASKVVKEYISANSFNTWLSGVYPLKIDDGGRTIVLGVPNELTRSWIQKNYQGILASEFVKINPSIRNVKLIISRRVSKKPPRSVPSQKTVPLDLKSFDRETNLNPDLVFENFIVAPYNRFAHTAAQAIMEKFGTLYNPFYVYGPTGVGKTHLLQAIGNKIKRVNPSMNVFYTTTEAFMENYINAIKKDRIKEFRNTYQNYQLFIIDDVHFLQKSESTLIEVFHLFNALVNKNAQIVLSSDQPPADLEKMEDRIRTRLNSGVVIDIEKPKYEDMRIVCTEKAGKMGIDITQDAIDYVVENISQNIREINGALKSIHLHIVNQGSGKVDIVDVKKYIKNHVRAKTTMSHEKMIQVVCDFYQIKPELLGTKLRKKEVVHARQIIMYVFREHLNLSYSFIGKQFGNRDHTTVMHACTKITKELQDNSTIQRDFEVLVKRLDIV